MSVNHRLPHPAAPAARRPLPVATLLICLSAGLAAPAHGANHIARVDIVDRTGGVVLPVQRHAGARWIVGERGHEYGIRIRNVATGRVLAVISVDGVNAVTGESAAPSQAGYVIEPGGCVTIDGWRKDLERTAAFVFTAPTRSYAARTDRPADIGVIGVALFREREPRPMPLAESATAQDGAGRAAGESRAARAPAPASASLGTGHGRSELSPAQWTAFERSSDDPEQIIELRYESRATLVAMGVLPRTPAPRRRPDPFPAAAGFVPDP